MLIKTYVCYFFVLFATKITHELSFSYLAGAK